MYFKALDEYFPNSAVLLDKVVDISIIKGRRFSLTDRPFESFFWGGKWKNGRGCKITKGKPKFWTTSAWITPSIIISCIKGSFEINCDSGFEAEFIFTKLKTAYLNEMNSR